MTHADYDVSGEQIKDFRKKNGLTQEDLAKMLDVSLPTLKRWENNRTKPRDSHLFTLTSILGGTAAVAGAGAALVPSLALGPMGPLFVGLAVLAGKVLSGTGSKSAPVSPDKPTQDRVAEMLWRVLEQVGLHFPIPRTVEERDKAEKAKLTVEVDRVLFDKFREEAELRGFTQSRLLESLLWLFLEMPPLSFQENKGSPEDV